ncbi:MAG: hypothetical protein ACJ8GW_01365 [Massilia sp.]
MKPMTHTQMTTKRNALVRSLHAHGDFALQANAVRIQGQNPIHFHGYRWEHAHHIRGGNP